MNITKRLAFAFSLLVFSLFLTNIFSIYLLSRVADDSIYFQKNVIPSIDLMSKEMLTVTSIRSQMYLHGLNEDSVAMDSIKRNVLYLYDELMSMQQHYISDLAANEKDLHLAKSTEKELKDFLSVMDFYFSISLTNDRSAISEAMLENGMVGAAINHLIKNFSEQSSYNIILADQANEHTSAFISHSIIMSAVATGLFVIVLGIFALLTVLNLRNRLNMMKMAIVTISKDLNLSYQLPVGRKDEIGQTIDAFNTLINKVSESLLLVRSAASSVSIVANQLSDGNNELSARTEQQSAAVVETAASMEELSSTVKQNAYNAHKASQIAIAASDSASIGGNVVSGVVARMKDISNSSKRISEIISVINGIAFQTNILALNAAVEAARAGDQGRGFAVVAGEVRSLAQRSAQAAKEIEALIQESVEQVTEGTYQVDLAGEKMDDIVNSVTKVKVLMQEIAYASDEQNQGISQIATAMHEMDTTTQHNASLVQESSDAACSLQQQAATLMEMVSAFHLLETKGEIFSLHEINQQPSETKTSYTPSDYNSTWETF